MHGTSKKNRLVNLFKRWAGWVMRTATGRHPKSSRQTKSYGTLYFYDTHRAVSISGIEYSVTPFAFWCEDHVDYHQRYVVKIGSGAAPIEGEKTEYSLLLVSIEGVPDSQGVGHIMNLMKRFTEIFLTVSEARRIREQGISVAATLWIQFFDKCLSADPLDYSFSFVVAPVGI